MGKVIIISLQKGGVGKSTTTGIVAHLLSQDGFKVLAIDMDSQGNLTELLSGIDPEDFGNKTIFEALKEENIVPYIGRISEDLHLVAGNDNLALLAELIYVDKGLRGNEVNLLLDKILEPIKNDYDYILIDTPPSLAEPMRNAICASDYVVIPAETAKYSFKAIDKFIYTAEAVKKYIKHDLEIVGILRTMNDTSWNTAKAFVDLIGEEYPDLIFDTVIKRNAATGRIAVNGFKENKEINKAVGLYRDFYEELKNRLGVITNVHS